MCISSDVLTKSYKNHNLAKYTTLKIGGNAEIAYFPSTVEELILIRNFLAEHNIPITVIGAGSNLLISSKGISGGVIFTTELKNHEIKGTEVKVDCGLKSWDLARLCCENSLSGLEFLIGIPGTVGGAVTMNSSAHGQAIEDVIKAVEILDIATGKVSNLSKSELKLSYRSSFVHKTENIILTATFRLKKDNPEEIAKRMEFHVNYRKQNHPSLSEPNSGSTFRNPARGIHVGKLLEELGAKNWREGGAKISDRHANFVINAENATSLDVSRLMYKMYNEIKTVYGHDLIAEIRYVGNMSEEEEEIWKSFQVH